MVTTNTEIKITLLENIFFSLSLYLSLAQKKNTNSAKLPTQLTASLKLKKNLQAGVFNRFCYETQDKDKIVGFILQKLWL